MGLTSLHDFYSSWHLYICRSLFGHSTFFCSFTRIYVYNFYKSKVCMVSAVVCVSLRRVWYLCNLPCVYALFRLISSARYAFKSPRICFWGTKYEIYREHVACLHSILRRRARLWLELFATTVGRSLSRISYLFSYYFLRRRRSFTSRKLYVELR